MRVDFYLLTESEPEVLWLLACRLIEKAYQSGHRVFVFCANKTDAERIDEHLWTYKDDSFIPHHLQGEGPEPSPPVQIGWSTEPKEFYDILLNLSPTIPSFHARFRRILEIVLNDDESKNNSREHYRYYRKLGADLKTHPIKSQT
jgi:DNA polymerase-3 subunit chi